MSVALATIHPGSVTFDYCYSVARVLRRNLDMDFVAQRSGALVAEPRNEIVEWFLKPENEHTHLWWVDSDIGFPDDTLERLLAADVPIVSAVYHGIGDSGVPWPVAIIREGKRYRKMKEEELAPSGLQEVFSVGMGCCLIRRDVLVALGRKLLWPYAEIKREGVHHGEDSTFCARAAAKGFKTYLLSDLKVSHYKTVRL